MVGNGRKRDVLIKDVFFWPDDPIKRLEADYVIVYADPGMKRAIENAEGVRSVFRFIDDYTYHAYLDPRYDKLWVKAEIEAACKIADTDSE